MLCRIGEIEVWRILDFHGPFLPADELFPNAGPDAARLIAEHVPEQIDPATGRLILPVQGFLLKTPTHTILVDACIGNDKTIPRIPFWQHRSGNRFLASLTAAGLDPADVDYVLCTHLHVDHIGWNTRLEDGRWVPTFPNAKYLLPEADNEALREGLADSYTESVLPVIAAGQAEMVSAGHQLGDHVTLVPTPGHTPGHVSVLVQCNGAEAVITGDAIHTAAQCWHPEWTFRFDMDPDRAIASRRALLEDASETQRTVLGIHFALPSIGQVEPNGDVFRWKPSW